jgi:8-oxo-dGTP pyrophosphatase MutT (NUDIX family)
MMLTADRIAAALALDGPSGLLPGDLHEESAEAARAAAVLVAITDRPRPGLILTQRLDTMRHHAGQVAFPGGRIDPGETAPQAALREAWEEIDLDPAAVRLLGEADIYRTITNFIVTPVVGMVPPDLPLAANPAEVADWFEVPLDFVLDPANQHRKEARFRGQLRHYFEIPWQGRRIWGATAAMLVNLARRLG